MRQQLDAAGYDFTRLLGVLVTHSHWDHVSGLDELPAPVWINSAELSYAGEDPDGQVFRKLLPGHEVHEYELTGPPYLGFPASFDVFGDGAVVVALAAGHTAGSVVVFVTLPSGGRYAFIGDLTWQLDGVRRRVERPWLLRKLADSDPEQVRQGLLRVIALAPFMQLVPAHDVRAYDGIPRLPGPGSPRRPPPNRPADAMPSSRATQTASTGTRPAPARATGPTAESEITWLLHRAAQRMRNATGERAGRHGLQLRAEHRRGGRPDVPPRPRRDHRREPGPRVLPVKGLGALPLTGASRGRGRRSRRARDRGGRAWTESARRGS